MGFPEAKWTVDQLTQKLGKAPDDMQMFTARSLFSSSIGLNFLEPDDTYDSNGNLSVPVAGVMIRMSTEGYPTSPTDGVLVVDNKELGKYGTGKEPYVVSGLTENQTHYFSAFPYSTTGVFNTRANQTNRAYAIPTSFNIYGISRDITSSSPAWARTDDAIDFTATASIGTVAGSSDFADRYPWSEMIRETFDSGDVMVKIPKFWFKRYREGNIEYIKIASGPVEGFELHPAFNHNNSEQTVIYVGAYLQPVRAEYKGSKPGHNLSGSSSDRDWHRTVARGLGDGWGIMDITTWSALQMLYLVEFADNNFEAKIGVVSSYSFLSTSSDPVYMTGCCDSVPNLTGKPAGEDGYTGTIYRGIEEISTGVECWIDGVVMHQKSYYVCNNQDDYVDKVSETYTLLGYSSPYKETSSGISSYIKTVGYDPSNPSIMLPDAVGNGANSTTYYCDDFHYYYVGASEGNPTGIRISANAYSGGMFGTEQSTGLSTWVGRVMYIPPTTT